MNLANKLTMLRVFMIPMYLVFLLVPSMENHVIALIIFSLASITDFLDGYIARKYNQITTLGKLLDPLADKLLTSSAFIAFAFLNIINPWIVIVIIGRELTMSVFRAVAASSGKIIAASNIAKFKTNLQMFTIIGIHLSFSFDFLSEYYIVDILAWSAMVITILSAVDYIVKNKGVLKE